MTKQDQPAFAGSTVVSTRRDSSIPGVVLRRRMAKDGTRFTTAEVSEAMLELLLTTPGGLARRNTALNPENIQRAVALAESGKTRKESEEEMGVSPGTFRRLLRAGGVAQRKYQPVMTDDNVVQAVKVSGKYDISKRADIIKASKELGVNARTLRRLLSRAVTEMSMEDIGRLRQEGKAEADAAEKAAAEKAGQVSMELTNVAAAEPVAPLQAPVVPEAAPREPAGNGHDTESATLVAVVGGEVVAEVQAPAAVAEAVIAVTAAMPAPQPEPSHVPGTPGFVERRSNPPADAAAIAAAAVAAVTAVIPAAVEAATHAVQQQAPQAPSAA